MTHPRKRTIAIVSAIAGTALMGGLKLATPALAGGDEHPPVYCSPQAQHHDDGDDEGDDEGRPCTPSPTRTRTTAPPTTRPSTTAPPTTLPPTTAPPTTPPPTTAPPTTPPPTTAPPTTTPPTTPAPTCASSVGNAANVGAPGVGAVTVTITVCSGTISAASSTLSQSNYGANTQALPAMDKLTVQYAQTDINMVNYSGASYTSAAYRTSLQSAMSKAGI